MDLRARACIPFPAPIVFAAFRDDIVELHKYMPHVRSIDVLSRNERGALVDTVVTWRVGANVPAFVRSLVMKEVFEWTDHATWDASAQSVDWRNESGAIRCTARDVFVPKETDSTELVLTGTVRVDTAALPALFGPFRAAIARRIARYVADDMPRSVQRVAAAFTEHLHSRTR